MNSWFWKTIEMVIAPLSVAVVLTACGGGGGGGVTLPTTPVPNPTYVERDISPLATDASITSGTESHVAITPAATAIKAGRLFVFLPGTGATPSLYRLILRSGASRGFHAIGLNYPNPTAIGSLCQDSTDANCYWDTRREVITGTDSSSLISVIPADSIVNRLLKAVSYLNQQYPAEGWGQFLAAGSIDWSKIIMAGHSQGGGHAGAMAKLYSLNRAVYFSSPADWSNKTGAPATWTTMTNVTPLAKQYGFSHLQDNLVPYTELSQIWQNIGLNTLGSAVSVDSASSPFSNSHQLTTSRLPNLSLGAVSPYHSAPVVDAATPRTASGTPVYEPVWGYLCFE